MTMPFDIAPDALDPREVIRSRVPRAKAASFKVQVDHSDGKSIWVFDRCAGNSCANSMLAPIMKFDSSGKFVRAFGANMFVQPHGLYVDNDGNVWAADNGFLNGKGAIVVKFSPDDQVLMTLGKPGMPGNAEGYLRGASSVVVAPNGDIVVGDGHGNNTNDRIVKFDKTGKQIATWGKHGKGQGEFDQLHGLRWIPRDEFSWPTGATAASRSSIRMESSSLNGSSSDGRATSLSTRTT